MLQRAETSPKTGDITVLSPTRPENVPKYKGFCIDFRSSRRHSMSLHVEAPFVKNFQFFIFGFFPTIWKIQTTNEKHTAVRRIGLTHKTPTKVEHGADLRSFSEWSFHMEHTNNLL